MNGYAYFGLKDNIFLGIYSKSSSLQQSVKKYGWAALPNFLSKGVRCGLDMKIARMGHTMTYFPFWLLIERSQMRRYHKKLSFVVRTKHLLNLMDVELLHVVTCRTEVLTWVELSRLVSEYLANSCSHSKT